MAVTTGCRFSPALPSLSSPTQNPHKPITSLLCPSSFKPIFASRPNPSITLSRSPIPYPFWGFPFLGFFLFFVCLVWDLFLSTPSFSEAL
ncbi:hypothetical protein FH972_008787 [Carpinus fangiana]|uniref:Uncharacterized protein n=1 Tax=Carpinus fangiana TaxID=176857 RepID=A0A5N6R2J5_9ROSI|nr:hypothetical protein FH972_008787 [Carpinus fangiana]